MAVELIPPPYAIARNVMEETVDAGLIARKIDSEAREGPRTISFLATSSTARALSVTLVSMADPSTFAECVDEMMTWVGLSGKHPDPKVRERQAKILLPNDRLVWALAYLAGTTSTCALVALAHLRLRGCTLSVLTSPYEKRIGQAVADVVRVGNAYGAWSAVPEELSVLPLPGDIVLVASPEHVLNVVPATEDEDVAAGIVLSIDGGAVDGSWTMLRKRIMVAPSSGSYLVDPTTPYKSGVPNGRRIVGKLLGAKLPIPS